MPISQLDSILREYSFTPTEALHARILTDLQLKLIQTQYAQSFKERGSTPIPENFELDRSYFLKMAELDGRLSAFQEMLTSHIAALQELDKQKGASTTVDASQQPELPSNLESRAAALVHQS